MRVTHIRATHIRATHVLRDPHTHPGAPPHTPRTSPSTHTQCRVPAQARARSNSVKSAH
jgi:hypothetical protein